MGCPPGTFLAGYDNYGLPSQSPICKATAVGAPSAAIQAGFAYAQTQVEPLPPEAPLSVLETVPGCNIGPGGPGLNQCPMAADGTCTDIYGNPGQSCALIRECDPCTGMQHVNYQTPAGAITANRNSWQVDSFGKLVWIDANGQVAAPPQGAAPPNLDKGVFTSQFNPTTQATIAAATVAAGLQYDPSAGWVLKAGSGPNETSPTIPAFTAPAKDPAVTKLPPTSTNSGTQAATTAGTPGAPGTSGVVHPVTAPAKASWLPLVVVAAAILWLSRS